MSMTYRELRQQINRMTDDQKDQVVQFVRDLNGENQEVVAVHLEAAPHDIYHGISIGNECVLGEGDFYFAEEI